MKHTLLIFIAAILSFTAFPQTSINGSSISGSGTAGYLPKFLNSKKLGNSMLYENGTGFIGTDIFESDLNYINYDIFLKVKRGSPGTALLVRAEYLDMLETPIKVKADISYIGFQANQPGFKNWAVGKGFNNSNHFEIMYSNSADGPSSISALLINGNTGNVGINTLNPTAKLTVNGTVNIKGLPTSDVGLVSGDIWIDGGTLKIVP